LLACFHAVVTIGVLLGVRSLCLILKVHLRMR
jgi:hypothetical protein